MSLRERAIRENPAFPWLDSRDPEHLQRYLAVAGFIDEAETVLHCEPAGQGNMNLTLWVKTSARQFVLKQARPWVEKYQDIAAPWNRGQSEARFYEHARKLAGVGDRMPGLLAKDPAARVILLEALSGASDFTSAYREAFAAEERDAFSLSEIGELARYLAALHSGTFGFSKHDFENEEMRELNFQHIFVVPYEQENGVPLDELESGLQEAAEKLGQDGQLQSILEETGISYRKGGNCLVHGDYYPGSWLRTSQGLRIIDAEFAFVGEAEVDLGCAVAHLALSQQGWPLADALLRTYERNSSTPGPKKELVARYASAEVIRRIIGVAQLPIPASPDRGPRRDLRKTLLDRARQSMLSGDCEILFSGFGSVPAPPVPSEKRSRTAT